ncbi:MAG: 2-phosphosulfolactate phosphatase [Anaerolineae bacterium]|nr:2-phosphosulfolactate phosphatase [Anaerolineae bacterium]
MIFSQAGYACRFGWGVRAARDSAERGDIVVIVDVLSFSSAVTMAVRCGAQIYPHPVNAPSAAFAESIGATLASKRGEGRSLSPLSFTQDDAGKRYVLPSPNGSTCAYIAKKAPMVLAGCLLNAEAVAESARQARQRMGTSITVVACGERWHHVQEDENHLRPAVEDYLGAGAILSYLEGSQSPEAEVCLGAFLSSRDRLGRILWECGSGLELRERGFAEDVRHCAQLNFCDTIPRLVNDHFEEAV